MNILLLASHAVAEYDDVRMFTDLGYDVFAPGGYEVPSRSGEGIRPALPDAPHHPELVDRLNEVREAYGDPGPLIDAGKARLHPAIVDWADVIIVHHFPERWIVPQWERIRHKRVIWRTCGQSNPDLERLMGQLKGLQIVRYSPAERRYFESVRSFAGEDALIRFGKYPADYGPWVGDNAVIGNVTQWRGSDGPLGRGDAVGLSYWLQATDGLPVQPAGDGSEALRGGLGKLSYEGMLEYLRHLRVYLYTGTTPASYTLGLMEAMLSGVPVVSIPKDRWHGPTQLFEGDEIAPCTDLRYLRTFLQEPAAAFAHAEFCRQRALDLFDVAKVGQQWVRFLG